MTFSYNFSENIFEVIGDYPVVDQFDVLYPSLFTGSMQDHYVTGSMFVRKEIGGRFFTFSGKNGNRYIERGRVFSKLGVDTTTLPSVSGSIRRSSEYQPLRERANSVRILRVFSNSERFFDSMAPKLEEMLKKAGITIQYVGGSAPFAYFGISDSFNIRFPFEPTFSGVRRSRDFLVGFSAVEQGSSKIKNFKKIQILDAAYKESGLLAVWEWHDSNLFNVSGIYDGVTEFDAAKIIFGFGDSNYKLYGNSSIDNSFTSEISKASHRPVYRFSDYSDVTVNIGVGPIIRGWKYGLQSATPYYTSAVFRRDRFGQFRDMLEQRQVVVSKTDYTYSPTNFFGDEPNPLEGQRSSNIQDKVDVVDDYVVKVSFVEQTLLNDRLVYAQQAPVDTWSSNLNAFVTSSLPYFDGKQTNRPANALVPPLVL
jgi:hypothetical protein